MIEQEYIETGKVRYIFRPFGDFANDRNSRLAAESIYCAGEQAKFWEMGDQLFKDQATWTVAKTPRETFVGYAKGLSLDTAKFETCLDGDWAAQRAKGGALVGAQFQITAAQIYFFADGTQLTGSPTFEQVKPVIDGMLGQ